MRPPRILSDGDRLSREAFRRLDDRRKALSITEDTPTGPAFVGARFNQRMLRFLEVIRKASGLTRPVNTLGAVRNVDGTPTREAIRFFEAL